MVDVLSFTTTLSVAVERGITVLPFRWKDERAAAYAAERDATLAVGRLEARRSTGRHGGQPLAGRHVAATGRRAAGAAVAERLGDLPSGSPDGGAVVSAPACATAPRSRAGSSSGPTRTVAVVAAGERWPDGSLRPCAEDLWGAGAVLAAARPRR